MNQHVEAPSPKRGTMPINTLVLLAILLAAGFILNLTVGKALSATGIQPEFIIAAFCLTILLARPSIGQALIIGLISAAVIQITTSTPGVDFIAEGVAAMLMALLVRLFLRSKRGGAVPLVTSFVTTFVSGSIYAVIATLVRGGVLESALVMAPVVLTTAVANALIVQALYLPLSKIVPAEKFAAERNATGDDAGSEALRPDSSPRDADGIKSPAAHTELAAGFGTDAADSSSHPDGESMPTGGHDAEQDALHPKENLEAGNTAASSALIELDDVSFSYGDTEALALDHVSLRIAKGDFLGVIAPSGAGKSTLAAALSGAIPHHFAGKLYGAVRIAGTDTCDATLTDISHLVGSVLQDIDAQMVAAEVEDELLYGLENFGVPHDQIPTRVEAALATAGIEELRHREIATLSGGQKQKVAVAAILALEPRALVLDEPTAALDPASSRAVYETLRRVNREQGITVVVIEQKVALLSTFCNRIAVMDGGRIALCGTPHEVFSHSEELRAIGVDSPRVARVHNSLVAKGLATPGDPCLTVEEAATLVATIAAENPATADGAMPHAPDNRGEAEASGRKSIASSADSGNVSLPATPPVPDNRDEAAEQGSKSIASSARAAGDLTSPASRAGLSEQETSSPAPTPLLVRLKDVSFAYPNGGASVEHISFEVGAGEFVSVVGANGAGKTTLTKLLNGLFKPATGSVELAGLDTRTARASEISAHAATLFQNPDRQICQNTVLEEVAFGLILHGVEPQEATERARTVIARFGLPEDEAPFSLSRGQRQVVALASVIAMEPEVLILDEPTSGLDYRECMTVMQAVEEQRERGCAVIMVCHDMEVASDFATRLIVMAGGHILADGSPRELFSDAALMRAASVEPPQAMLLSSELTRRVNPAFAGLSEVADIVDLTARLAIRRTADDTRNSADAADAAPFSSATLSPANTPEVTA